MRHTKLIHCRDAPSVTQDGGIGLVRAVGEGGEGTLDLIVKFFFFIRKRVVIGRIFRGPRGILRHTTTGRVRSGDSSLQALYFNAES